MATWPATLPQCGLHSGWASEDQSIVLSSSMDAGPPKRRQRFTANYPIYNMSMVLTLTQWQALRTFYDANAAITFTWTDPLDLSSSDVVFASRPQCTGRAGDKYMVSFQIEVQP